MPETISQEGARTYWFCSVVAFRAHHLTLTGLHDRWFVLSTLSDPHLPASLIPASLLEGGDEHRESDEEPQVICPGEGDPSAQSGESRKVEEDGAILHFIPSGLNDKWVFTTGDPDPNPSIPHGHYRSKDNPQPKLNPYTGKAWSGSSEVQNLRLSRKEMVRLWNDDDFREMCRKNIEHFVSSTDRWRDFLPADPFIFPKPWAWDAKTRAYWQRIRTKH